MIDKVSIAECCGCEACAQTCPIGCIEMVEDVEGFLFPKVDLTRCSGCNQCEKVCPAINQMVKQAPTAGYAYRAKDEELLKNTSSGGFFTAAAEKVLSAGGVVFGAAFNENHAVVHTYIESVSELDSLRRSKYVQSKIGSSFLDCRKFLEEGRGVLFCGTPCQIKALNLFLGKEYANLVTIDFVCHGVPSPGVFRRYLQEFADEKNADISELHDINFRAKNLDYAYSFAISFASTNYVENPNDNIFLRGFLTDVFLRKSCYNCSAKSFVSGSNYTMCDFWTIRRFLPDFKIGNVPGVSQVFVFDDCLNLFTGVDNSADTAIFNVKDEKVIQRWAMHSVPHTPKRQIFYDLLKNDMTVRDSVVCACKKSVGECVILFIRRTVWKILSILKNR